MRPNIRTALIIILAAGSLLTGAGSLRQAEAARASACPAACITEYTVPSASAIPPSPSGIAVGPDGRIWFHEASANKIGRITMGGRLEEYTIPTPNCCSQGFLADGPDEAIWFTEDKVQKLGRITMGGHISEYPMPSPGFQGAIVAGPDHALWITETDAVKIARRAPDGRFTEYGLPNANSNPLGLTVGSDGALWFTEVRGNRIGRITTSGQVTEYAIPTDHSLPLRLAPGPDGAIWFTEGAGDKIGRITMDGKITEYPAQAPVGPVGIVAGPDGALWYAGGVGSNMIGRITTEGSVTTYLTPSLNSVPFQITVGPDAALWFTEAGAGKVGRLQLPGTVGDIGIQPGTICAGSTVSWLSHPIPAVTRAQAMARNPRSSPSGGALKGTLPCGSGSAFWQDRSPLPSTASPPSLFYRGHADSVESDPACWASP